MAIPAEFRTAGCQTYPVNHWAHDGDEEQRCHKKGASATARASAMMEPDFDEALAYNSNPRLGRVTMMIDGRVRQRHANELRQRRHDDAVVRPEDGPGEGHRHGRARRDEDPGQRVRLAQRRAAAEPGEPHRPHERKLETFAYDPLGRLKTATTKLSNSATATRTLSQTYHANGNLKTKTSSVNADMDVSSYTSYGAGAAGPHAVTGARIEGKDHTFRYDADGNMISDQCAATGCDDRFIEWNGRNLPERITVGGSQADPEPTARDEFAYGPDGARYHRKTSYMDGETLRTENTYYVGSFEELLPRAGAAHTSIRQTRVTDGVRHVKTTAVSTADDGTKTTNTAKYVDYIHKDHLGSVQGVTGAAGARTLAHDPFGSRRKGDWTAALTDAERLALAGSSDPRTRGHTGHEHLDRTGLIHRGGRVYDPALGRFLSPDPLVGNRGSAQAWNGYSYVSNSPMSFVDPSGLSQAPGGGGCNLVGVMCGAAGGGFGLASVVSTHRFLYVDIFFSVSSLITLDWGSGSGVIYNYSGESDPYFGGWGWGSFDAFAGVSYGYSYWSGSAQVTSQVAVASVLNITHRDIGAPSFDFGFDDRLDIDAFWGALLGQVGRAIAIIASGASRIKRILDRKPRKPAKRNL